MGSVLDPAPDRISLSRSVSRSIRIVSDTDSACDASFSLLTRTRAAAQAVEGAREVVFSHPPSSPFVVLAAFGPDQLSGPMASALPVFTAIWASLGSALLRVNS